MSEDYILSSDLPVAATSANPVAPFSLDGAAHAIVIVQTSTSSGAAGQPHHVFRDPAGDTGWDAVPLFGGVPADEVAGGTQSDGTAQVFYADGAALYRTQFQPGGGWTAPQALPHCTQLAVAYTPDQQLILYGVDAHGRLQVVRQVSADGPWQAETCDLSVPLGSSGAVLVPVDELNWTLGAAIDGKLTLWTGQFGGTVAASGPDQLTADAAEVVVGTFANGSVLFLHRDPNGVLFSSVRSTTTPQPVSMVIPDSDVRQATGFVDEYGMLHVYSVAANRNLWVLHQTDWTDDGAPAFAPYIPLDRDIQLVTASAASSATLFTVSGNGTLRHAAQDADTGRWSVGTVRHTGSAPIAYPVTRYRTQVTVRDADQVPVPGLALTVTADELCDVWISGTSYLIGPDLPVQVTTDAMGKLVIASTANRLCAPTVWLAGERLTELVPIRPDEDVHSYLAGAAPLNGLPQLTPAVLADTQVNGEPLAPDITGSKPLVKPEVAFEAISKAMNSHFPVGRGRGRAVGWAVDLSEGKPALRVFTSRAEFRAYLRGRGSTGDWWSGVSTYLDDFWRGVETGATKIEGFVVDAEHAVLTAEAHVGNEIRQLADVTIRDIRDAVSVVHGVLSTIGADLAKVLDWLKEVFDWEHIRHTRDALEGGLRELPGALRQLLDGSVLAVTDGFFVRQEALVQQSLAAAKDKFRGKTMGDLMDPSSLGRGGARPPRRRPAATAADGMKTLTSLQDDMRHNWLLEKVMSYGEGDLKMPALDLHKVFTAFTGSLNGAQGDVQAAWMDAKQLFEQTLTGPGGFSACPVNDLLDLVGHLALATLKFGDAMVHAFVAMLDELLDLLDQFFATPVIDLSLVSLLSGHLQSASDDPGASDDLTLGGLACLLAAIPVTLAYKDKYGIDTEPFPTGALPSLRSSGVDAMDGPWPVDVERGLLIATGVLQALSTVSDLLLDWMETPPGRTRQGLGVALAALGRVCAWLAWPTGQAGNRIGQFTPVTSSGSTAHNVRSLTFWIGAVFPLVDALWLIETWNNPQTPRYVDPAGKLLLSVMGAAQLIAALVAIFKPQPGHRDPDGLIMANMGSPVSPMFQFARLNAAPPPLFVVKEALNLIGGAIATCGWLTIDPSAAVEGATT